LLLSIGVGTATMKNVQSLSRVGVGGQLELGPGEVAGRDLGGLVVAALQLVDALLADVEADGRQLLGERQGHREADVTETDHRDLLLLQRDHAREETTAVARRASRGAVAARRPGAPLGPALTRPGGPRRTGPAA
jgi:hypothetical protein